MEKTRNLKCLKIGKNVISGLRIVHLYNRISILSQLGHCTVLQYYAIGNDRNSRNSWNWNIFETWSKLTSNVIFELRIVHLHNKISFLEQSEHSTGLPIVASYPESLMGWRKMAQGDSALFFGPKPLGWVPPARDKWLQSVLAIFLKSAHPRPDW